MEAEEIEAVLERIWDLHDKLSDAIHSISRSHFLLSTKSLNPKKNPPQNDAASAQPPHQHGFVFVKELDDNDAVFASQSAVQEAKSLNAIRTALESLEDQLEFLRTIQTQQQAERDAAIARLDQSRLVLAMRLAEHQGKRYKVIEEALAFVGDVQDASHFVSLENLYGRPGRPSDENLVDQGGSKSNPVLKILISSFNLVKNSLAADHLGGLLGNAAVFAISMMALLRLHQVAYTGHPYEPEAVSYDNRNMRKVSRSDGSSSNGSLNHLDVMLARG